MTIFKMPKRFREISSSLKDIPITVFSFLSAASMEILIWNIISSEEPIYIHQEGVNRPNKGLLMPREW